MTVNIPTSGGVPGISGPPDWFSAPPTGSYDLEDVRWRGATKRTFGAGGPGSNYFRAGQAVVGGQQFIYLSFRAAFVQSLSDQYDMIYLGLERTGGTKAMVIEMKVHGTLPVPPAGLPSSNPPANIQSVQIWTRLNTDTGTVWTGPQATSPSWIANNARVWIQSSTDIAGDPNNRWAVQLRIPAMAAGDIAAGSGPNLGTDFNMWYVIHGTLSTGSPVILADYRTSGSTTEGDLQNARFPNPFAPGGIWDQFLLTSGPAAFGGVMLDWGDVFVQNATYGLGTTIDNGQPNTFVARPRNYRPAGNTINAGDINATFRIANWGSLNGDPHQIDFNNSEWKYVVGNSAPGTIPGPVDSNAAIPPLPAGNNPPNTNPIALGPQTITLDANKSLHQCILVNLSGTNLNFLNDSIYRNMNFDAASLLEQVAEISVVGLAPFAPEPRDVYLAIEKISMPGNTPAGTNEGRFLESSMNRLIAQGGPLAEKLKNAQAILSDEGDYGSSARLEGLLGNLHQALAEMPYSDPESGRVALSRLIQSLSQWLSAVKQDEAAADRLAQLFSAFADWLFAGGPDAVVKLNKFILGLGQWLASLDNDPASSEHIALVLSTLSAWLSTLSIRANPRDLVVRILIWLDSDRSPDELAQIVNGIREFLSSLSTENSPLRHVVATFSEGCARWLKGYERLVAFVSVLSDVGLTDGELDQLFPTFRVHAYHDTGERITGSDGKQHPVLRAQSSFGIYAYHERELEGWVTSLQGATRIADNLYLLAVPNNGVAKVNVRIQGVGPGEERIPEDPIIPIPTDGTGCCSAVAAWLETKGPLGKIAAVVVRFICRLLGQLTR